MSWRPGTILPVLMVLASARNIERIADNRELLAREFLVSSAALAVALKAPVTRFGGPDLRGRGALTLIDPFERSQKWLLRPPTERRAAAARYADYSDLMRRVRAP